jgi:hypothetical protein
MDELIPFQEPKLPLAKHVELNNLGEIIKLHPSPLSTKDFPRLLRVQRKLRLSCPHRSPKLSHPIASQAKSDDPGTIGSHGRTR